MTVDLTSLVADWAPEPVTTTDDMAPDPVGHLTSVLGPGFAAAADATVPPMWHWLYFLDWPAAASLGPDGHPATGPFLPPVPHRRRMWAGGRLTIHRPLRVGVPAARTGTVRQAVPKSGRSGPMLLVTVRYDVQQDGALVLSEEQDHLYRSATVPTVLAQGRSRHDVTPVESDEPWQLAVPTDERTLFALSALTANSHRIHYDEPYATGVEGFPGVVVHGPLLVLAMLQVAQCRPESVLARFDYRLTEPVFAGARVLAVGGPDRPVRVVSAGGRTHARAQVGYATT